MFPVLNHSSVTEFVLLGFSNDPALNKILFIIFLLLYLCSVLGNGLIIILICLDSHLHTPMYFFLSILSILDMGHVTATVPQLLVHMLSSSKLISFTGCWLQMYLFGGVGLAECIFFVVMAYDRYVAICFPLRYMLILNWNLCVRLVVGTWVSGFFLSLVHTYFTMKLPFCGPNIINHYFCEGPSVRNLACMDTHFIEMVDFFMSIFIVLVPLSLILASYVRITMAILKIKSTQGRHKAFSTCASHVIVVTMFYTPSIYIYLRPNSNYSPERDKLITLFSNMVTSMLNPVVYSLRNKDIKAAFIKVVMRNRGV
ncbi:olfactory receptor 2D2-like [Antechinus flavipes]|uniref:olfactory receptor 2D2-like n=1 Tax=Antechinus flavipes TaxID=38775 RepID=UPI002235E1EF|nr:olfactory receptor 2D2-like [Antechinus flavipes]